MSSPAPRVLYIEDSLDDVELTRRVFERSGALSDVVILHDGQSALNYVMGLAEYADHPQAANLKLILLDLNLPRVPGKEVLRQIKLNARTRHIPVVVLSVTGKEREAFEKGPFPPEQYLRKPLELHTFLNLYRDYVQAS